jgi:hypothetical protein
MLNLGYDWLHALLPHVLAKINRVHYGLLRPHELESMAKLGTLPRSRRFLAVPFVGKDAPSPSSEYAHPDVAIGLTIFQACRCSPRRPLLSHRCARKAFDVGTACGFHFSLLDIGGGFTGRFNSFGIVQSMVGEIPAYINEALDRFFGPETPYSDLRYTDYH